MLFNKSKTAPHDIEQQLADARRILKTIIPLNERVYHSKASLFISRGFDRMEEFLYYIIALLCFGFLFIMNSVFPFYILGEVVNRPVFRESLSNHADIGTFHLAVKGLVVLIGLLFIFLGLKKKKIRHQKTLLNELCTELKNTENYFREKEEVLAGLTAQPIGPETKL